MPDLTSDQMAAREDLIRSVLRLLSNERSEPHAHLDADQEYTDDLLMDAAKRYIAQVTPPTIVTICGSMRFFDQMLQVAAEETAKGHVVLAPFSVVAPEDQGGEFKAMLDELHRRKIDMADQVVIVTNQDGYVGTSTRAEMVYAAQQGMRWDVREFEVPPATSGDLVVEVRAQHPCPDCGGVVIRIDHAMEMPDYECRDQFDCCWSSETAPPDPDKFEDEDTGRPVADVHLPPAHRTYTVETPHV